MDVRAPLLPAWLRWLAVLAVAGFVAYVSLVTVPPETVVDQLRPGPPDLIPLDKWRHFVAYAAVAYALAYATTDWDVRVLALAVAVVTATVVYGVGIEVGQSFLPARYFSVDDAYANALGGVLVLPWYVVRPYLEFVPLRSWLGRWGGFLPNR